MQNLIYDYGMENVVVTNQSVLWGSGDTSVTTTPSLPHNKIKRKCLFCGKTFYAIPSLAIKNKGKFCDRKCYGKWQSENIKGENNPCWRGGRTKVKATCKECGKDFFTYYSYIKRGGGKFCSNKCSNKMENNSHYKDGRTPLNEVIRHLPEYKLWRINVFKRDDYTCKTCKKRGGNLEAHHKKKFSKCLDYFLQAYNHLSPIKDKSILVELAIRWKPFWDIDNGETFCKACHIKQHPIVQDKEGKFVSSKNKKEEVAECLGIELDAHDALNDIRATREIFMRLMKRILRGGL